MFEIIYEIKKIGIWPEKSAIHYIKKHLTLLTLTKKTRMLLHMDEYRTRMQLMTKNNAIEQSSVAAAI